MTLEEYKEMKLKEIDKFLRGIHFENNGKTERVYDKKGEFRGRRYLKIVDDLQLGKKIIPAGIINRNKECHKFLEDAINGIKYWRDELENKESDLYTSPITKESIDKAVDEFIKKVMEILNELKNQILNETLTKKKIKINDSFETSSLGFIRIKVADKIYPWEKEPGLAQVESRVDKEQDQIVDGLASILFYIYILPDQIKESKQTKDDLLEIIKELHNKFRENNIEEPAEIINLWGSIKNTRSKQKATVIFAELINFIDTILPYLWIKNEKLAREVSIIYEKAKDYYSKMCPEGYIPATEPLKSRH